MRVIFVPRHIALVPERSSSAFRPEWYEFLKNSTTRSIAKSIGLVRRASAPPSGSLFALKYLPPNEESRSSGRQPDQCPLLLQ